ncbi:MAG: hypothetical protein R6U63_00050 [Longimicrobiales bacterium]
MAWWKAYAAALAVLLAGGVWSHAGLADAGDEARAIERRLAEVRRLLEQQGPSAASGTGARLESIGAAVQAAADRSGLGARSIEEVRVLEGGTEAGHQVRLRRVGPEGLVRLLYVLESELDLRTVELEMRRPSGQARRWDVSLVVVRVR